MQQEVSLLHYFTMYNFFTGVVASNNISEVKADMLIHVQVPLPSMLNLQVSDTNGDFPSCIPEDISITDDESILAVFVGKEVELQASVATGVNVTFYWHFVESGRRLVVQRTDRPECSGITCLSNKQVSLMPMLASTF